MFVINGLIVFR